MTLNMNWLNGKKTYIVAGLIGLVTAALYLGWITKEVADVLYGLLGAAGVATLRAGIAKSK